MGIRGLSSFIENNPQLLTETKLHDCRVVIDGNNLFHVIYYDYNVAHQFGGDYDHFARKVAEYFNTLRKCNISPYVVFDGGYEPSDRKLSTILERAHQRRHLAGFISHGGRGKVFPILGYETFRLVLVKLGIPHVSCMFEADDQIAALANDWQCSVMSNDSDFFIFDIKAGFVPLDYMNVTVCEGKYDLDTDFMTGKFSYIPVKIYYTDSFLQYFQGLDKTVLPLFATLLGNDYVGSAAFANFYAKLNVPKRAEKKFCFPKSHTRMISLVHWLDSLTSIEEGLEEVLQYLPVAGRDELRATVCKSMQGYSDNYSYKGFNLREFFDTCVPIGKAKTEDCEVSEKGCDAGSSKLTSKAAKDSHDCERQFSLKDFYGNSLQTWFVKQLRTCGLAVFLQNVAVLHRIILSCQVEQMSEPSSHQFTRPIRQVIYSVVLQQTQATSSATSSSTVMESRENCVEEYDREVKNQKRIFVPLRADKSEFGEFPSLHSIPQMAQEERKLLILKTLQMPTSVLSEMEPDLILIMSVICFWVKNADPRVTPSQLSALLVCILALSFRYRLQDRKGDNPLGSTLNQVIAELSKKETDNMKKNVDKYFHRPHLSNKDPMDGAVVHNFSQFQSCLLDVINLNQLLQCPFPSLDPSLLFSGTFVYNFSKDLESRVSMDLFIAEMLVKKSAMLSLFKKLEMFVLEVCGADCLQSRNSGRKRSGKKLKKESQDRVEAVVDVDSACSSGSSVSDGKEKKKKKKKVIVAACSVTNKFASLGLLDDDN